MGLAPAQKKPEHAPAAKSEPVVQKACATCASAPAVPGTPKYMQAKSTMDKGAGADLGGKAVGIATSGVSGAAAPLPHLDRIQQSFGAHDVTGVKAAVGGDAGSAASQLGARAYTVGDRVGFRDEPDLRLAAHEAAHTVQQQQGVQLEGGVGKPGDVYERQADAAADAVVEGRSAESLLGSPKSKRGGTGVQMACSCGGTCSSCGGPQVQFDLEANIDRDIEPVPVIGGPAKAPDAGGGGAAEGGEASEGNGESEAPAPEQDADAKAAEDKANLAAGEKACPAPADPPQAEKQEAGEDEGDCSDYGGWGDKTAPAPPPVKEGETPQGPPEPAPAEIKSQPPAGPNPESDKATKTKPEKGADEKPAPPEGCEDKKPETGEKGGDSGATEDGGGGDAGGPDEDPMEAMIREALEHRESGRTAYRDGASQLEASKSRVREASSDPVRFANTDSGSERASGASAVATRELVEMGGDANKLLDDVQTNAPARVNDSLNTVKFDILAARDRSIANIDAEFDLAKASAQGAANGVISTVRAQHLQTVVSHVVSASLAVSGIIKTTLDTTKAIAAAQSTQMSDLADTIEDGADRLITAGTTKGAAAMAIGRQYHSMYMGGVTGERDSLMAGYVSDRRAKARAKAAFTTATGMRDSFAQEAAGQAREFVKTRAGHCSSVIKTAEGATKGVNTGAGKAIAGIYQLLGAQVQQATADRDSRTKQIRTQLAAQLATLSQQAAKQRQTARDTAYVQVLAVQLTAQQMTGDLLGAAAQAVRNLGDGISEARSQLESGAPASIESTHVMMRVIRGRVTGAIKSIRERLGGGLERALANVGGHTEKSRTHIDRHLETARESAAELSRGFGQAMSAQRADALRSFGGQRTSFRGSMTKLQAGITHAFGCAVKNVEQSYEKQLSSIESGNKDQAKKLEKSFQSQIDGSGKATGPNKRTDGLVASIRYYACVAARHERPAWEEIAKFVLIIVIAIVVSALLGPVVGAMVGAIGLAGAAATIVTAIIVGAIAGAISSVAGQLFDNAMSGRRLGYGVAAAAKSGAISGAIGGFFGGVGAVFAKAAASAGAGLLTKFAIQFTADMASEYATQVATNLMEGKSLGKSLTDVNASGFIMAGAMSAGMFALHSVKLPGSKKTPPELPPGLDTKLSPRMQRVGAAIKNAETAIKDSKPVKAAMRTAESAVASMKSAGTRLAAAFKGTKLGAVLESSGALGAMSRGGRSLLGLLGKLQDLNTALGEKTTKVGERFAGRLQKIAARYGIKLGPRAEAPTPHDEPAPKDASATPHDAPNAPKEGPLAHEATTSDPVTAHESPTPHESPTTPHESSPAKPTDADFKSVEASGQKPHEALTPEQRLAEQRVAEHGDKLPPKEPFTEAGKLPNEHPWGETPEGTFCRFSGGSCSNKKGQKVKNPPGMGKTPLAGDVAPAKPTADAAPAKVATPEPAKAGTPEPAKAGTPEPAKAGTPEPAKAGTPEPAKAGTPEPAKPVDPAKPTPDQAHTESILDNGLRRTEKPAPKDAKFSSGDPMPEGTRVVEHFDESGTLQGRHYVDADGRVIRSEVRMKSPNARKKDSSRPTPEGMEPTDHRGHSAPERHAADQRAANVPENLQPEHSKSNLSPKKRWENKVPAFANNHPNSEVFSIHEPTFRGKDKRPTSMSHGIEVDGQRMSNYDSKAIPNDATASAYKLPWE